MRLSLRRSPKKDEHKEDCFCELCQQKTQKLVVDQQTQLSTHVTKSKKLTSMVDLLVDTLEKERAKREKTEAAAGLHGRAGHTGRS